MPACGPWLDLLACELGLQHCCKQPVWLGPLAYFAVAVAPDRGMSLHILQVNATGVMPVIFSSSLLAAPAALSRYFPQVPLGSLRSQF